MGFEGLLLGRTLLERYRVDAVIGRGAMGVVYRAMDLRLNRPVATKVLAERTLDAAARERFRARFRREAEMAARVNHEHVVRTYDFGTDLPLDLDVLVMELLEGLDLEAWVARHGPAPPVVAQQLLTQAGRGLGAGHRLGLVHRDVKPSNLLVTDRGGGPWLFVLDFGIVEMAEAVETLTKLTFAGFTPGTLRYASPEQIQGVGALSPASDVFSLGATAFELLTGQQAFESVHLAERLNAARMLSNRMKSARVPPELADVITRAVDPQPERRFAHGDELAEALLSSHVLNRSRAESHPHADERSTRVLSGRGHEHQHTRPLPPTSRRFGSWLFAGIAGAVVAVGFAVVVQRENAPPGPPVPGSVMPILDASTMNIDSLIAGIRGEYQRIERVAPSLEQRTLGMAGFSTHGGLADLYFESALLVKAVATLFHDDRQVREEYFFREGALFFVYRRVHRYGELESDVRAQEYLRRYRNSPQVLSRESLVDEGRFYFHEGRMIRWLNRDREDVQPVEPRFAEEAKRLLTSAARFQEAGRGGVMVVAAP